MLAKSLGALLAFLQDGTVDWAPHVAAMVEKDEASLSVLRTLGLSPYRLPPSLAARILQIWHVPKTSWMGEFAAMGDTQPLEAQRHRARLLTLTGTSHGQFGHHAPAEAAV